MVTTFSWRKPSSWSLLLLCLLLSLGVGRLERRLAARGH